MADNVTPIRPVDHHKGHKGRPHALADPEFCKQVAQAFVDGLSREAMCEMFGVRDRSTISRWRRDPRIKGHAMKMVEDRVMQITRKVDAKIEGILNNTQNLTVTELLAIRKEFLGGALRTQTEKADEDTMHEATAAIEANPNLVEELEALLASKGAPVAEG